MQTTKIEVKALSSYRRSGPGFYNFVESVHPLSRVEIVIGPYNTRCNAQDAATDLANLMKSTGETVQVIH